jgi:hypothetical protein
MMPNGNGNGAVTKIAEITAEAIRTSGLKTADDIRAAVKQARETLVAIEHEAEETAQAIIEATNAHANRISGYIDLCAAASASFKEHRATLTDMPLASNVPPPKMTVEQSKQVDKAVDVALADLKLDVESLAEK